MRYLIISLTLSLIACGKPAHQDSAFKDQILDFEQTYQVSTSHIDVSFSDTLTVADKNTTINGQCDYAGHIIINPHSWAVFNADQRKALIFHEFGHCIFNRPHQDHYSGPDKCQDSIMSTNLITSTCFEAHKDALLHELYEFQSVE